MSATNRGSTRKPHDFYPTPISTIETFLDVFPLRGGIEVLEPGAGSGNIIKTLQKYGDFSIDAVEIRPEEAQHLQDLGVNVIIDDFLSMDLGKKYDLIIGNPPFNQAIEFVEKCLGLLKPGGRLIFLLRTAFMESDQRFEFWQQEDHRLAGLYTLHKRPSFTGHGTDATDYEKKIYLPELLPLEEYDLVIVLFSGGKDSTAAYFKLLELGVPKNKIELWHHDIDGKNKQRRMDWPCTQEYVKAFAEREKVTLRVSWRDQGFWGEVYRVGASYPIRYMQDGEVKTCSQSKQQIRSQELREQLADDFTEEEFEELKSYGYRMKFPAKAGDLMRRWCSGYLKIDVAAATIRNLETISKDKKILIVSGERRGESSGRSKYNEMEIHRSNATAKAHRLVHQWRAVIDYSERDVWEVIKRNRTTPHPCYSAGWNRCSCMMCIFSLPRHWAGIRELFPEEFEAVKNDEERLGFTLDNKKDLEEYVGDAESCVCHAAVEAIRQIISGKFTVDEITTPSELWDFPAGAFKGSDGGPC